MELLTTGCASGNVSREEEPELMEETCGGASGPAEALGT